MVWLIIGVILTIIIVGILKDTHAIRNYDRDRENILLDLSPSSLTSGAVVSILMLLLQE